MLAEDMAQVAKSSRSMENSPGHWREAPQHLTVSHAAVSCWNVHGGRCCERVERSAASAAPPAPTAAGIPYLPRTQSNALESSI